MCNKHHGAKTDQNTPNLIILFLLQIHLNYANICRGGVGDHEFFSQTHVVPLLASATGWVQLKHTIVSQPKEKPFWKKYSIFSLWYKNTEKDSDKMEQN